MSRQSYGEFKPGKGGNSTFAGPKGGSSNTRIGGGSRIPPPSSSKGAAKDKKSGSGRTGSTSSIIGGNKTQPPGKVNKNKKTNTGEDEFVMPAFSLPYKKPKFVEKDKKKHMRRNKPAGEDVAKLKEILKGVRRQDITIQEYIGLISPSTGDNGETLRNVLAEELATFRNLARKIYETNTQDVSDVLTNEHIQITEGGNERKQLYEEKMMRSINEIFMYCSDFQFERYYTQLGYLDEKFPTSAHLPEYGTLEPEDEDAMLRQEAYHRYQWLKNEGERLNEENKQLQARLHDLKKQQRDELRKSAEKEQEVEIQHEELEAEQEELKEKLEELEQSVEKCLVDQEIEKGQEEGKVSFPKKKPPPKTLPKPKTSAGRQGGREADEWAMQTATQIEDQQQKNVAVLEAQKLTIKKKESTGAIKKKRRQPPERSGHFSPLKTPPPRERRPPKENSPFHYSPLKTPPGRGQEAPREMSPFHYSPPPAQSAYQDEAMGGGTPRAPMHRTTTSTTIIDESERRGGRGQAPRDSWGGFY